MVIRYSDTDINGIIEKNLSIVLDSDIMTIINDLTKEVGNPEYVKTPQFSKRNHKKGQEDWGITQNFKVTVIKKREGVDGSIDIIRKFLNKMTMKTYDKLSVKIAEEIKKMCLLKNISIHTTDNDEIIKDDVDINKIGEEIFTIASSSIFFSDLYATFYIYLTNIFPNMRIIFQNKFESFSEIFHDIKYCSPNENYDKFCENNKNNDRRRSLGLFYVNLMLKNAISIDSVFNIILTIQNYMLDVMKQEDKSCIVDELSELTFIMISKIIKSKNNNNITDNSVWKEIILNIRAISNLKNTSYPSITNKSIFKHLDIIDILT
jgi:hypothetical protein